MVEEWGLSLNRYNGPKVEVLIGDVDARLLRKFAEKKK